MFKILYNLYCLYPEEINSNLDKDELWVCYTSYFPLLVFLLLKVPSFFFSNIVFNLQPTMNCKDSNTYTMVITFSNDSELLFIHRKGFNCPMSRLLWTKHKEKQNRFFSDLLFCLQDWFSQQPRIHANTYIYHVYILTFVIS